MLIYTLPLIAALTGWITNFIAVKMLFHPKEKVRILFFDIQGIFPKRKEKLAEKLGKVVSSELFSVEDLKNIVTDSSNIRHFQDEIGNRIDVFLNQKLAASMPMLAMFINDSIKEKIKQTLLDEFNNSIPEILKSLSEKIDNTVDIEKIVYQKVVNFSSDKLEEMLYSIMKKEFRFIEILGGVLGFIIGLIQLAILQLQ